MLAHNMPGLANGLIKPGRMPHLATGGSPDSNGGPGPRIAGPFGAADASNGPSMAYGGFAVGGQYLGALSNPGTLPGRAGLSANMSAAPYSTAAGLINSLVPGRTDQLTMDVPSGSYIVPADVVSALGQGNTLSGAKLLEQIFTSPKTPVGLASGGAPKPVPVVVAGGEVSVSPAQVVNLGRRIVGRNASYEEAMAAGHKALDKMVLKVRAQNIRNLKKLPGPKK